MFIGTPKAFLDKLEQSGKLYPSSPTKIEQMFIGTPEALQPKK